MISDCIYKWKNLLLQIAAAASAKSSPNHRHRLDVYTPIFVALVKQKNYVMIHFIFKEDLFMALELDLVAVYKFAKYKVMRMSE